MGSSDSRYQQYGKFLMGLALKKAIAEILAINDTGCPYTPSSMIQGVIVDFQIQISLQKSKVKIENYSDLFNAYDDIDSIINSENWSIVVESVAIITDGTGGYEEVSCPTLSNSKTELS